MKLFRSLEVRASQGTQYIRDLRAAVPAGFRGRPVLATSACETGCTACRDACPTRAIALGDLGQVSLDLGRCVFCSACSDVCPTGKISFSPEPKMGAATASDLIVREGDVATRVRASETFAKLFGRSLKMRQVSAGGCNACELELNALVNVNFDVQRYGIEWVASPRHADALVITGPLTRTMRDANLARPNRACPRRCHRSPPRRLPKPLRQESSKKPLTVGTTCRKLRSRSGGPQRHPDRETSLKTEYWKDESPTTSGRTRKRPARSRKLPT